MRKKIVDKVVVGMWQINTQVVETILEKVNSMYNQGG